MATDPKVIAVARAIKQSVQQNAGPGSAINAHPNAFFLHVNGEVDFYKAAEMAVAAAKSYEESAAAQAAMDAKKAKEAPLVVDETRASAVDGH